MNVTMIFMKIRDVMHQKDVDLSNDELVCNECKEGYLKNTNGQCFSCFVEIGNCNKCKLEIKGDKKKLICENCLSLYYLNDKKDTCELNECEEYPDISPGCIICKDKLNEYKSNNKCQECKFGYFKTKDDKCVYCRSEKYGGPACYECGYKQEQNEKILMILYVKIAIHILRIFTMMIIMIISALLYLLKENAIIVNMIYLKTV